MKTRTIQKCLLDWYRRDARTLPWRGAQDPYAVWVSEVMLQQTRVETVIPYYERWMRAFPDVASLARAPQDKVLKQWEGLGYYSRARNLHKAAAMILRDHGGDLPDTAEKLRELPGVGDYIAGAIASIAFGQHEPALDGNGLRVLARLRGYELPVNTARGKRDLGELLRSLLPVGVAGEFNQAIMDLGAGVCLPRSPRCDDCPLAGVCAAFAQGCQGELPVRKDKKVNPHYEVVAAVIVEDGRALIDKRSPDGLLGGLWEFPGGKVEEGEGLSQALERELCEELGVRARAGEELGVYRHAYTHFSVTVHTFFTVITGGTPRALQAEKVEWVEIARLKDYPMGKVDRSISSDLAEMLQE